MPQTSYGGVSRQVALGVVLLVAIGIYVLLVLSLQYQAPPFNKIKNSDFKPAMAEGMKQQLADMQKK